jgi:hypothetical protein
MRATSTTKAPMKSKPKAALKKKPGRKPAAK